MASNPESKDLLNKRSAHFSGSVKRSAHSTISSRYQSSIPPGLQLLTPEEVMEQELEDLEIEDYGSSGTDLTDDELESNVTTFRSDSNLFQIAEPLKVNPNTQPRENFSRETTEDEYYTARQIALLENDIDMDSDEERDIIKEIKAEITGKVKEEMKDELEFMKRNRGTKDKPDEEDAEEMDPKLKEAFIKMRKLDKILAKKIKKEREVKRDRIHLQRKLKQELDDIAKGGKQVTTDEKTNTSKFLALTLPPSHDKGVILEEGEENAAPSTPLFHTQPPEDIHRKTTGNNQDSRETPMSEKSNTAYEQSSRSSKASGSTAFTTNSDGQRVKKKKKDFIKRNIHLASDAGETIAMTDDEKQRLNNLLTDIDTIEDVDVETSDTPNPYQIVLSSGEGFLPTQNDQNKLESIDQHLKELLPPDDFESICSNTPSTMYPTQSVLFTRTTLNDVDELGERALKEVKGDRKMNERLKSIEEEINRLSSCVDLEIQSPSLSETQLNDLLDMCARTMSRATDATDSLASSSRISCNTAATSSRSSLIENPPKLPDDVLQALLADARSSQGSVAQTPQDSTSDMLLESINAEESRGSARGVFRPRAVAYPQNFPTTIDEEDSARSDKQSFLPPIDPKGSLSTQSLYQQKLNNEDCTGSRLRSDSRNSAITIRNALSEERSSFDSPFTSADISSDFVRHSEPRPPSTGRSSNASGRLSRNTPVFTRNRLDSD